MRATSIAATAAALGAFLVGFTASADADTTETAQRTVASTAPAFTTAEDDHGNG